MFAPPERVVHRDGARGRPHRADGMEARAMTRTSRILVMIATAAILCGLVALSGASP